MQYMKVTWHHDIGDIRNYYGEPVMIYAEIDDKRFETRKVEINRNGELRYASKDFETDEIGLSWEPIPTLEEIAQDPQFTPEDITQAAFEEVWRRATVAAPIPTGG